MKIRIMASHGDQGRGPVPKLVYRAEAYDESERFPERKWSCDHDHDTVELAFHCGEKWMAQNSKID